MKSSFVSLTSFCFLFVVVFSFSNSSSAAILVLQDGLEGYNGTEDATIYDLTVDFSNGASPDMTSGRTGNNSPNPSGGSLHRIAIRFDLSPVPTDVTILGVTLEIRLQRIPPSAPNDVAFSLHPIVADWNEGSVNGGMEGAAANPGDITWSSNLFITETWTTPGGDFGSPSATITASNTNGFQSWSSPQLTQDVIDWVAQPQNNFGWMLIGDESGPIRTTRGFNSSEANFAANRPRLIIVHDGVGASVDNWELYDR